MDGRLIVLDEVRGQRVVDSPELGPVRINVSPEFKSLNLRAAARPATAQARMQATTPKVTLKPQESFLAPEELNLGVSLLSVNPKAQEALKAVPALQRPSTAVPSSRLMSSVALSSPSPAMSSVSKPKASVSLFHRGVSVHTKHHFPTMEHARRPDSFFRAAPLPDNTSSVSASSGFLGKTPV